MQLLDAADIDRESVEYTEVDVYSLRSNSSRRIRVDALGMVHLRMVMCIGILDRSFFCSPESWRLCKPLAYSKSGGKILMDNCEYAEDEDDIDIWELFWYDLQNQRAAADQVTIHGVPQGCRDTIVCVDSPVSLAAYAGSGVAGREGRMS
ncbi:hypothetical protein WN943_019851 [Citrus x changshan-huyou]